MRILYLDCFSGISGDMFLGALLSLSDVFEDLSLELGKLNLPFSITARPANKNGVSGIDVDIHEHSHTHDHHDHHHAHGHHHDHHHDHDHENEHDHEHHHDHEHEHHEHDHAHEHNHQSSGAHHHRGFSEICRIIDGSTLSHGVKARSKAIFQKLAESEAAVHNATIEEVHFHEVGAIDAIGDIVGACVLLELLNIDKVYASKINVGSGTVMCAHGVLNVPAPATQKLLSGLEIFSRGAGERTTPTGAAIVATITDGQCALPSARLIKSGYGFGKKDFGELNALCAYLLETCEEQTQSVCLLETNIDDMTGEELGFAMERLFDAGALDVFFTPIYMKKNRPAHKLSVLCHETIKEELLTTLFKHTTTLGVREQTIQRHTLNRQEIVNKDGVRMKHAKGYSIDRKKIEYEDVRLYAQDHNIDFRQAKKELIDE